MRAEIRSVEKSDIEDIRELNKKCWEKAFNGIIPEDKIEENTGNYPRGRLREKMEDNELLFLVAEVDGKVVGTINFCWGDANTHEFVDANRGEAQLRSVYLHPDYWGQGIGTKLFQKGLEKIPNNINTLKVESLRENDIGRSFYEKLGFEKVEESSVEIFGNQYDSVIQRKDID